MTLRLQSLFKTPTREYDFLINLKPEIDTQAAYKIFAHADSSIRQAWESHQRNQMSSGMAGKDILVDFNPVTMFVQDLEVSSLVSSGGRANIDHFSCSVCMATRLCFSTTD